MERNLNNWWLITDKDVTKIGRILKEVETYLKDDNLPQGMEITEAIHTLDTGLHTPRKLRDMKTERKIWYYRIGFWFQFIYIIVMGVFLLKCKGVL